MKRSLIDTKKLLMIALVMFGVIGGLGTHSCAETYEFDSVWGNVDDGFHAPEAIAISTTTREIYVADTSAHRILKFDLNGLCVDRWGKDDGAGVLGTGYGEFNNPRDVTIDTDGYVYVADTSNQRIQKFDSDGVHQNTWMVSGYPSGITVDSEGYIYIVDTVGGIQKLDASGNAESFAWDNYFLPYKITVDKDDNIYVAGWMHYDGVRVYDSEGTFLSRWGNDAVGDGKFTCIAGITTDHNDRIYVADKELDQIQRVEKDGSFIAKWGSNGSDDGEFLSPYGVAVDWDEAVYITDSSLDRIQKFYPRFVISGYLKDAEGKGVGGATVTLNGSDSRKTTTDTNGYYEFVDLGRGSYIVVMDHEDYDLDLTTRSYSLINNDYTNQDYIGTVKTYKISGNVKMDDEWGSGVLGATVTLVGISTTGSVSLSYITAEDGYYEFELLRGSYTVVADKEDCVISPSSSNYYDLMNNVHTDYAVIAPRYAINGRVMQRDLSPIVGATVTLEGAAHETSITDITGYYDFQGLLRGDYIVTVECEGYEFESSSTTYIDLNTDYSFEDYIEKVPAYNISGYVYDKDLNAIKDATVTLRGGAEGNVGEVADIYFITGDDGYYEFTNVSSCYIEVYCDDYFFDPNYYSISQLTQDITNQNFIGTERYTISGQARDADGKGISNVNIVVDMSIYATVVSTTYVTDTNGYYVIEGIPEFSASEGIEICLRAEYEDYVFTPSSTTYTFIDGNKIQDFIAEEHETLTDTPVMELDNTWLDFGSIKLEESKTLPITITNTSSGTLSGTITADKEWIELSEASFSANSQIVNVSISRAALDQDGYYTGAITIISNGGTAVVFVSVTATCVLTKPNPYNPRADGYLLFYGSGIVAFDTEIQIFTVNGEHVRTLHENIGAQEIPWDGKNENGDEVVSGIYVYASKSPQEKWVGKFTVIKK